MTENALPSLLSFPKAVYLGGLTGVRPVISDYYSFHLTPEALGVGDKGPESARASLEQVASITVDTGKYARTNFGDSILMKNVPSNFSARETPYIYVHLRDGSTGVYVLRKGLAVKVAQALEPVLAGLSIPMTEPATPATPERTLVALPRATFLGGLTNVDPASFETGFIVTDQRLGLGATEPVIAVIKLADVQSVTVDGGEFARSRVGAALLVGAIAFAMKGTEGRAYISVNVVHGETAVFMVRKADLQQVRATLTPVLKNLGLAVTDGIPGSSSDASDSETQTAEERPSDFEVLKQLGQLHEAGVLTDEEFASKKAEVLARM